MTTDESIDDLRLYDTNKPDGMTLDAMTLESKRLAALKKVELLAAFYLKNKSVEFDIQPGSLESLNSSDIKQG